MMSINRRDVLLGIAGSIAAVAAMNSFAAGALNVGETTGGLSGDGADVESLRDQLLAYFGSQRQPLLQNYIVNEYDTRSIPENALLYDQFIAVFGSGPAEHDSTLDNGMRMIVRFLVHDAAYKAIAFVNPSGSIAAAALALYRSPRGGITERFGGKLTHFACENNLSVFLFFKDAVNVEVIDSVREYLVTVPTDRLTASMLGQRGPRMKLLVRRV